MEVSQPEQRDFGISPRFLNCTSTRYPLVSVIITVGKMLRGNVLGGCSTSKVTCGKGRIPWISWGGYPALTFESLLWGSKRGELLRGSPLLLFIVDDVQCAKLRCHVLLWFVYAHFIQLTFHALKTEAHASFDCPERYLTAFGNLCVCPALKICKLNYHTLFSWNDHQCFANF